MRFMIWPTGKPGIPLASEKIAMLNNGSAPTFCTAKATTLASVAEYGAAGVNCSAAEFGGKLEPSIACPPQHGPVILLKITDARKESRRSQKPL